MFLTLPESSEFPTFPIGQVEKSGDSGKLDVTSRNTIYPLQSSARMKGINSGATCCNKLLTVRITVNNTTVHKLECFSLKAKAEFQS